MLERLSRNFSVEARIHSPDNVKHETFVDGAEIRNRRARIDQKGCEDDAVGEFMRLGMRSTANKYNFTNLDFDCSQIYDLM